ncbi:MAG: carbamoyl phosphate synthase small subunit [Waddliaceae bacterium]|nr:carbamoyl phosphate synthase small subunit [Waddliaceae bacterium]
MQSARLVLQDGTIFHGLSPSWQDGHYFGELVFSTGMTGYCESITDPSYTGEILTFTYPLIGNYGVPDKEHWESSKAHAFGVVIDELCENWSHHEGTRSFIEFLEEQNVPLITGIDTRALTRYLRSRGTVPGAICCGEGLPKKFPNPHEKNIVASVSTEEISIYNETEEKTVVLVDCGMKENILRQLQKWPLRIKRVPHDYDYTGEDFDGVFYSNGPGDPTRASETITVLQKAMKFRKPIFGICLGTQLMALAAGAKTYKLPFGHRGHNQPCMHIPTGKCFITSQNHGYAIEENSLPEEWEVSYRNLNDQSIEGISHKFLPFGAVQFHPEACPGPTDTFWIFEQFYKSVKEQVA